MNAYDDSKEFKTNCASQITQQGKSQELVDLTKAWVRKAAEFNYSYHFEWLGRPIIQHPEDMVGVQQLLWNIKPSIIIETGIARGGSLIFYSSILELIAMCGGPQQARVIGIDVDIRDHNKREILNHPMSKRIEMIEGSSVDDRVLSEVTGFISDDDTVLVCLDSLHTHDHVLEELRLYAPLVSKGSYCVVFDTIVEDMPDDAYPNRPWGIGNNPKTAVHQFLEEQQAQPGEARFEIDKAIENQLLITVAPDGFLKRI